jgi:methylphosphotriester-DNA--protein-cysteine methyltransferase
MPMPTFTTPESRWAALVRRDPLASNSFVYCVTTTKIFCRPSCPSRLARRANITFRDTAAQATADGFRACKRCRPAARHDAQQVAVARACELIESEATGGVRKGVRTLAKEVGFTESYFCRVFKRGMGMTVGEYRVKLSGTRTPGANIVGDEALADKQGGGPSPEFDFNAVPVVEQADPLTDCEFELDVGWDDCGDQSRTPDAPRSLKPPAIVDSVRTVSNQDGMLDTRPHESSLITVAADQFLDFNTGFSNALWD